MPPACPGEVPVFCYPGSPTHWMPRLVRGSLPFSATQEVLRYWMPPACPGESPVFCYPGSPTLLDAPGLSGGVSRFLLRVRLWRFPRVNVSSPTCEAWRLFLHETVSLAPAATRLRSRTAECRISTRNLEVKDGGGPISEFKVLPSTFVIPCSTFGTRETHRSEIPGCPGFSEGGWLRDNCRLDEYSAVGM